MASSIAPVIIVMKATDTTVAQYTICKVGADDEHCSLATASSDKVIGIVQSATATAADDLMEVAVDGGAQLKIGSGGCVFGDMLVADSSGYGVVASDQGKVIAQAMAAAAQNDVIPVILRQGVL